jgi:hypothetical protein
VERGVRIGEPVKQLCGGVEDGGLAFGEQGVAQSGAVVPERQVAGGEFFGQELFLGQEVRVNIAADETTALQEFRPEQCSEQAAEADSREPLGERRDGAGAKIQGRRLSVKRSDENRTLRGRGSGDISIEDAHLSPRVAVVGDEFEVIGGRLVEIV